MLAPTIACPIRVRLTKARRRPLRNQERFSDYGDTRKPQNRCSHLRICNSKEKHRLVSHPLRPLAFLQLRAQPLPKVAEQPVEALRRVRQTYKQVNRLLRRLLRLVVLSRAIRRQLEVIYYEEGPQL